MQVLHHFDLKNENLTCFGHIMVCVLIGTCWPLYFLLDNKLTLFCTNREKYNKITTRISVTKLRLNGHLIQMLPCTFLTPVDHTCNCDER